MKKLKISPRDYERIGSIFKNPSNINSIVKIQPKTFIIITFLKKKTKLYLLTLNKGKDFTCYLNLKVK